MNYDPSRGVGTLHWKPNPVGRPPVKYRVYGSDEKGFSISDVPYKVNIGQCKELPSQFPANFIAETAATELAVIGSQVESAQRHEDILSSRGGRPAGEAERAFGLCHRPAADHLQQAGAAAKVGAEYRYQVQANRCLGDLRVDGKGSPNFWDIEKPKFAMEQGPKWLKLDPATGVLSGTPDAAGKAEVVVSATIDRQVRKLDEAVLKWGQEKVASATTRKGRQATQPFVIEVSPIRVF